MKTGDTFSGMIYMSLFGKPKEVKSTTTLREIRDQQERET